MIANSILEMVGNTPILKINNVDTGPCTLYLKMENCNPSGSIKDRIALHMLNAAEEQGKIKPGDLIIEASSGNMGGSLALVCALKGYRLIVVAIDKVSEEKRAYMEGLGAEVVITPSTALMGHPDNYMSVAKRLTEERGGFFMDQFFNNENAIAHEKSTAPEILEQMGGNLDAVVFGVGTSGTMTGISRHFAKHAPDVDLVLADPVGSSLTDYVKTGELGEAGSWLVEGIGEDFLPGFSDFSRVSHAYQIPDQESFDVVFEFMKKEGVFMGTSAGCLVGAALRYCREQTEHKHVLSFVCDDGFKYASKYFNKEWMKEKGLSK